MRRSENFLPFFIVFFGLSILLILIGNSGLFGSFSSIINKSAAPIRSSTIDLFSLGSFKNKQIKSLINENAMLRKQVSEKQSLMAENKALKDQFAKSSQNSQSLLPAKVVGAPGFVPGVSLPEYLVIDKGSIDGVRIGTTIIVGNYLVGKVISLSQNFAKVALVNSKNSSFIAKIVPQDGREISGIIKGKGSDEMIFDNVLLTTSIKKDDIVLTKGEKGEKGIGFPPDLIVGKIVSVEKKSSDLFQKAEVLSFVDFTSLSTVFVLK